MEFHISQKSKKIVFLSSTILLFFIYIYPHTTHKFNLPHDKPAPISTANTGNTQVATKAVPEKTYDITTTSSKSHWNPMGGAASEREIKTWFAAHGNYSFYDPEEQNDYKNYNVETLINLANQGDIKAMHMLADTAKTAKDLKPMLNRAAIYGSTQAIIEMGSLSEIYDGDIRDKPLPEQKTKILEAFAYFETAKMRGDWTGVILYGKPLLERYNLALSEEDKKIIQENAQKIYADIQQQRTAEGLSDFDNQVPEPVMNYYKEMLKPY